MAPTSSGASTATSCTSTSPRSKRRSHRRSTPSARRRSAEAVRRANEAVGTGAVTRFAKVSAAAWAGRGRELILEEDFQVGSATGEGPDDPVDNVVEAVLTHGGEVTMVPHDTLADHGGIVLTLRY